MKTALFPNCVRGLTLAALLSPIAPSLAAPQSVGTLTLESTSPHI